MTIHAYLLCWNEIDMVKLVVSHYQKFCDKITIMDNWSTDGSDKLAESLGCEVIKFGTKFFDDQENMNIKNNVWKGSKADWVLIADFDECLWANENEYHETPKGIMATGGTRQFLFRQRDNGATIIKTYGWQIMSEDWPANDLLQITNGYEFSNYAKNIVFNPRAIKEINYGPGAHECKPVGQVVWSTEALYVLHYKHIGGVQRTIDRYKEYQKRMSKNNRKNGWGIHYNRTPASIRQEWAERMAKSSPLI